MSGWWDHLLHTPMRELAWYDWIAAVGVILMSVAVMIGGATVARWGMQRLRRGKPTPEQLIAAIKTDYAGQWVAVHGGRIYAAAATAAVAYARAQRIRHAGTIVYVPRPEEIPQWAARFDREGRIGPNDEHATREGAERWARSCARSRGPATLMQRVDSPMHLGGTWIEIGPIGA
jgi:hypothetical protein